MRLWEDDGVAISSTWGWTNNRHNHPLCLIFAITHIKQIQIIRGEWSTSGRAAINDHLHLLNVRWRVRGSWWWRDTFDNYYKRKLDKVGNVLPFSLTQAFSIKLNKKVSPVIEYLPVSPVAPPNRTTLFLLTKVMVCPNLACGVSPNASSSSTAPGIIGLMAYWVWPPPPPPSVTAIGVPPCFFEAPWGFETISNFSNY